MTIETIHKGRGKLNVARVLLVLQGALLSVPTGFVLWLGFHYAGAKDEITAELSAIVIVLVAVDVSGRR